MTRKIFKSFVTIEDALNELYKHFTPKPVGVEEVSIDKALGRVLATNVYSEIDVPPYDRSTVDGFAVIASDLVGADEDNPITLKKIGELRTGVVPAIEVSSGTTIEISTGAMIPPGANAVVMVEYTDTENDNVIFYRSTYPGENIQSAGSDIMMGELVMRQGTRLSPRELGVLAAIGLEKVLVYKKPKVAILSTGDEIAPLGKPLKDGQIYDINSSVISGFVQESGCEPIFLGIARDNADEILDKIKDGLTKADVVITSGSTSAGVKDVLYQLIGKLGSPGIIVHGIKIKPGKPTLIGVIDGKPLFGLPGYPTSAAMVFTQLFAPILRQMAGLSPTVAMKKLQAKLTVRINTAPGRRNLIPVYLLRKSNDEHVALPAKQESGSITSFSYADGFIIASENVSYLDEGEVVTVNLFSSQISPPDITIMGSHCVGVDLLSSLIHKRYPNIHVRIINTGSMGGLRAIKRGDADIAGMHLFDEATKSYNIPYIKNYGLEKSTVLVRGYVRELGFVVAKGNPKQITSVKDLLRHDVRFINRIAGSGTRIYFDMLLKNLANEENTTFNELVKEIKGYEIEAKTHNAVAAAVKYGRADVGLAIKPVAIKNGLDFIPLTKEHYDFLIQKVNLSKPSINVFLEILKSDEFKKELPKQNPGLFSDEKTGEIIFGTNM